MSVQRQGGGLDGGVTFPSAGDTQDRNSRLFALKNSYVNDRLVTETNVQYSSFRWNYSHAVNPTSPQVTVLGSDGQTVAVLGNDGFVFDDLEKTWQGQQKATFLLGNHAVKAGVEAVSSDFALAGGGNVNGNYLVQLSAAQEAALRARNLGAGLSINDIPADVQAARSRGSASR